MTVKNPISLGELAIELGLNKSKLVYYAKVGIISPIAETGRMHLYEKEDVLRRLKFAEQQREKHSLADVAKMLNNME